MPRASQRPTSDDEIDDSNFDESDIDEQSAHSRGRGDSEDFDSESVGDESNYSADAIRPVPHYNSIKSAGLRRRRKIETTTVL